MSRRQHLTRLRESAPIVLPSLLLCDFGNLEREVGRLRDAGVRGLHLDVMDGNFVPNLTYGIPIVRALRRLTDLPLDVHLMIERPRRYLRQFAEAGADVLTVHVEAVENPTVLREIRDLGLGAGIALNPDTPLDAVVSYLPFCDLVLVMSVPAGFGGQSFRPVALEKLQRLREIVDPEVLLEVDGGVNRETVVECARAGARMFVAGSAIFQRDDYRAAVEELTGLASREDA